MKTRINLLLLVASVSPVQGKAVERYEEISFV
jgi:hypothetical protein